MYHLANPIARSLAGAMFLGGTALAALSPATCLAQEDAGISHPADQSGNASSSEGGGQAAAPAPPPTQEAAPARPPTQEKGAAPAPFDPVRARIRYLHDRLRITRAQEPLWAKVADVLRNNATAIAPLLKERLQSAEEGNAVDNLGTYEKLGEAQLQGLEKFVAAFKALYAGLSDDQKKIADTVFRLGPLSMVGGIPLSAEELMTPELYADYSTYAALPGVSAYPPYAYYPPYMYYSYYNPWIWGPSVGLGAFFFAHRFVHPFGFHPGRIGRLRVSPGRVGIIHRR